MAPTTLDGVFMSGTWPMRAADYSKRRDRLLWPVYVQPELKGERCIAVVKSGSVRMWDDGRKRIAVPAAIKNVLLHLGSSTCMDITPVFDGVIDNNEDTPVYHIYDIVDVNGTLDFHERYEEMQWLEAVADIRGWGATVTFVETWLAEDTNEFDGIKDRLRCTNNYVGVTLRSVGCRYVSRAVGVSHDYQRTVL